MQKNKSKKTKIDEDGETVKKRKTRGSSTCPYHNSAREEKLSDQMLIDVLDVEQLGGVAQKMKACPYYAGRQAIRDSRVTNFKN